MSIFGKLKHEHMEKLQQGGLLSWLDKTKPKPVIKPSVADATKVVNKLVPQNNTTEAVNLSKKQVGTNLLTQVMDKYYNPEVKKGITSGDKTVDFIYNNQWLMDVPVVGNIIKNKAKEVAIYSAGSPTVSLAQNKSLEKYNREALEGYKYSGSNTNPGGNTSKNSSLLEQYFSDKPLFKSSVYKPKSDYMTFLPSYSVKGDFDESSFPENLDQILSNALYDIDKNKGNKDYATSKNSKDIYNNFLKTKKPIYLNQTEDDEITQMIGQNLAGHKTGMAWDEEKNLPYVSISDAWDFEPIAYAKKWGGFNTSTDAPNKKERDRAYIQASLMHKAGKPFKIYDRFYFDPATKKYISDEKLQLMKKPISK